MAHVARKLTKQQKKNVKRRVGERVSGKPRKTAKAAKRTKARIEKRATTNVRRRHKRTRGGGGQKPNRPRPKGR